MTIRILAYSVDDLRIAVALKGLSELLALTYLGPVIAMSHAMVPPAMRAFASSILFLVLNLIGLGLGPVFTGVERYPDASDRSRQPSLGPRDHLSGLGARRHPLPARHPDIAEGHRRHDHLRSGSNFAVK